MLYDRIKEQWKLTWPLYFELVAAYLCALDLIHKRKWSCHKILKYNWQEMTVAVLVLVCMITESLTGIGGLYDNVPWFIIEPPVTEFCRCSQFGLSWIWKILSKRLGWDSDEDNHQIGCFASASANIVYSLTTVAIIFRTKLICCDVDSSVSVLW